MYPMNEPSVFSRKYRGRQFFMYSPGKTKTSKIRFMNKLGSSTANESSIMCFHYIIYVIMIQDSSHIKMIMILNTDLIPLTDERLSVHACLSSVQRVSLGVLERLPDSDRIIM